MLSTVVLSNENQTCRGWEAPTSTGGGGCHKAKSSQQNWKLSDVELLGRCPAGRHTQQGHYAPAPYQFATERQGKQTCFLLARAYTVSLRQVRTAPYPHSVPVPQFRPDSIPAPYRKTNRNTV